MSTLAFIDVARGIAILMVILVHTSQSIPGLPAEAAAIASAGQLGVQLFFVASAYTLCGTLLERREEPRALLAFYLRRVFRIAPLYYLAIAIYFTVHVIGEIAVTGTAGTGPYGPNAVVSNLLFIHGFVPWANNNIVPGGWSIGTEMAFYLVFPFLFKVTSPHRPGGRRRLMLLLAISILLNVSVQVILDRSGRFAWAGNHFIYFNLINQLPCFIAGMLVFRQHLSHAPRETRPTVKALFFFLLFSSCGVGVLLAGPRTWVFVAPPILFGFGFASLLDFLNCVKADNRLLCAIGKASYSMYVLHFLFAWHALRFAVADWSGAGTFSIALLIAAYLAVCAATFFAARLTQKWIEGPGIALGKRLIGRINAVHDGGRFNRRTL